jgi:hypothetical protein
VKPDSVEDIMLVGRYGMAMKDILRYVRIEDCNYVECRLATETLQDSVRWKET